MQVNPPTPSLLVIDDDPMILQVMKLCLPAPDYQVFTTNNIADGKEIFSTKKPDALLLDIQLAGQSGLEAMQEFHALDRRVPVIMMTGFGTAETAISAMSGGAFQYVTKPFEPDEILPLIDSAIETSRMARMPAVLSSDGTAKENEDPNGELILGQCPAMVEVFRSIGRVASRSVAVLVLGETGTGKEVVARAIYQHSKRCDKVFHAINCAAIPEDLLESELFGHEKGSFTGADQRRIGKFEICNGGTLFLDEIGDMSPLMQAKVLRVLQEKEFVRVGGSDPIKTNVRIIAATNRDLDAAMADGGFRSDLFYRLNEFTIQLPALRDRGGDIEKMAEHFFKLFSQQLEKEVLSIAPETMQALASHSWPGNVRELQGVVKQTLLKASGPIILPEFLPTGFGEPDESPRGNDQTPGHWAFALDTEVHRLLENGSHSISDEIHDQVDQVILHLVLKSTDGNLTEAAARLGVSRPTLRNRMRRLPDLKAQPE